MTIATPPNQKSAPPQLKIVLPFAEIGREDVGIVGGKGANLGEMARFGLPVPNGFVATVAAYATFLAHNELSGRIQRLVDGLDVDNTASLQSAAAAVGRRRSGRASSFIDRSAVSRLRCRSPSSCNGSSTPRSRV